MNSPLLGVDIGFKRTGVALSESGIIAHPLQVIEADPPHMSKVLHQLVALVGQYSIKTLVIGMPYHEDESLSPQAEKVTALVHNLQVLLNATHPEVKLVTSNEFYTSKEAKQLYPTTDKDSAAAAIILQDYITSYA